jgi:hypothetical protein
MIKMNNILKTSFYSFIAVMGIIMVLPASSLIQVQAVTEDDGWNEDPNDGQTFEEEEEQAEVAVQMEYNKSLILQNI